MSRLTVNVPDIERIGLARDRAGVPALREVLRHPDPVARQSAATALGRIGDPAAVPDLLDALRDPAKGVRQSAAWALGQIKHRRATVGLQEALRDSDRDVRRAATWALGQIKENRAWPDLLAVQSDPDDGVRRSASAVVGQFSAEYKAAGAPAPTAPAAETRSRRRLRGGLIVGALLVMGVIGVGFGALTWSRPLGPPLISSAPQAALPQLLSPPHASDGNPQCGGPPLMVLLLLGVDSGPEGLETGSTDVIRVARIDFVHRSVILLAIPRDLWVTIPGLEAYDISENRIKAAYAYGNHYQTPGGGVSLLAQTLAVNFGLEVDHYTLVDFQTFARAVDALGGVDLYLPEAIGTEKSSDRYFPPGWQHMDGETALAYARVRPDNTSDLKRIDRQTQVLMAARQKVFSTSAWTNLPALVDSLQAATRTDLSPAQISSVMCISQRLPAADISVATIDSRLFVSVTDQYGYERLLPDSEAIRRYIRLFQAGNVSSMGAPPGG